MPLQTISTIAIPPTTTMSAHVVASNPHPQYLLASNLASAAKLQIELNGLVDVNYTSAADGDILVHSGATWSLTNLNSIISGLTIYPATVSTYGTVILATYPDISNNVSSTVITPNLISSYVSMVSTNIHREFSTAIDTSITNIPYATTTTSGRIRLATQAEANSSDFENADIVPAITPNVMRTYTSNYVSTYHGSYLQNMLSAGTGIYIDPSSVSTGSTVYNGIRVSDVPISEVVDLGTSLANISTSLVNLNTSKQLALARSGRYTSVVTSTINENTDNETQVDTVHCTIEAATTNDLGLVTITDDVINELIAQEFTGTKAITPFSLSQITHGIFNVLQDSNDPEQTHGTGTKGSYILPLFRFTDADGKWCFASSFGRISVNNKASARIYINLVNYYKLNKIIFPTFYSSDAELVTAFQYYHIYDFLNNDPTKRYIDYFDVLFNKAFTGYLYWCVFGLAYANLPYDVWDDQSESNILVGVSDFKLVRIDSYGDHGSISKPNDQYKKNTDVGTIFANITTGTYFTPSFCYRKGTVVADDHPRPRIAYVYNFRRYPNREDTHDYVIENLIVGAYVHIGGIATQSGVLLISKLVIKKNANGHLIIDMSNSRITIAKSGSVACNSALTGTSPFEIHYRSGTYETYASVDIAEATPSKPDDATWLLFYGTGASGQDYRARVNVNICYNDSYIKIDMAAGGYHQYTESASGYVVMSDSAYINYNLVPKNS